MPSMSPTAQENIKAASDGLDEAAAAAGYAPSIHNTQPWRWRLSGEALDLFLERDRVLPLIDADLRLATLSCGAALHHARTTLAAEGWHAITERMPDAADQDHLARLRIDRPAPADPEAIRHVRTLPMRHTSRGPATGRKVVADDLEAIHASMRAEGAWLLIMKPDQVIELSAAADLARVTEGAESAWHAELAYWTRGARPPSIEQDRGATFGILYGHSDEPRDWIRAGEALSAGWLTATERGVSVLPLSAPVEMIGTRNALRRILAYLNHPYLVVRFGTTDRADADTQHAPRLPAEQTVQRK